MMASGSEELPPGVTPAASSSGLFPTAFAAYEARVSEQTKLFFVRRTTTTKSTTPLLLLHGFPQTHTLWYQFVSKIPAHYDVIVPDLPGYGQSTKAPTDDQHTAHSKREMGKDLFKLVDLLYSGQKPKMIVYGHDRGGRVAYRMALDHPERLFGLAVLDIVPTTVMFEQMRLDNGRHKETLGSYHWIFLASPSPVAETLIGGSPEFFVSYSIDKWTGSKLKGKYDKSAMTSWTAPFVRLPSVITAACEDYRAGATRDLEAEAADQHKLRVPTLVLYSSYLARFDVQTIWRDHVEPGVALRQAQTGGSDVGHFIPLEAVEECWAETAAWLKDDLGLAV